MFAVNDKIRLAVINVKDREGKILPINISMPFNIKKIAFPENISQLSIFEYHEGIENYGHNVFNIYVGHTGTFEQIINNKVKIRINNNFNVEIKNCEDQLVYYEREDGVLDIFATVQENDIVVNNVEELSEIVKSISNELSAIKRSIAKIRKLGKNNKKST